MGEGMPYHLEKGPTLRIIEQALNGDGTRANRCKTLNAMRSATGIGWIDAVPGLWEDPRFQNQRFEHPRTVLLRDWFGYEDTNGTGVQGQGATTGYWIGYKGDVEGIVRGAVQWALELSLVENAGVGADCKNGPGPLEIELFWKCPAPWFEAWVVRRPVSDDNALVSVTFVTPSHRGANVAESPIATSASIHAEGLDHPVPSTQADYAEFTPPGGNPPAADDRARRYAMWVVSHRDHKTDPAVREQFANNLAAPGDFNDWGIPYLNVYQGMGPLVVVSPSLYAGGVRRTGDVL